MSQLILSELQEIIWFALFEMNNKCVVVINSSRCSHASKKVLNLQVHFSNSIISLIDITTHSIVNSIQLCSSISRWKLIADGLKVESWNSLASHYYWLLWITFLQFQLRKLEKRNPSWVMLDFTDIINLDPLLFVLLLYHGLGTEAQTRL